MDSHQNDVAPNIKGPFRTPSDQAEFSWSGLVIGVIVFFFFGILYWLDLRDSGLTLLLNRLNVLNGVWMQYYAHLLVSLLGIQVIWESNFVQAIAYNISILPEISEMLKKAVATKSLLRKNYKQLIIGVILLAFVISAGSALLDMIHGLTVPKGSTLSSLLLAMLAGFVSKIQYYPYIKPHILKANVVGQRHLVWETYQTQGKIQLASDQYAYVEVGDDDFQLKRPHKDIEVFSMTRVFFIQPARINFKGTKMKLGIGNVRGNVMFDLEVRINEIYLPVKLTELQLSFLSKVFSSSDEAFEFIKDNIRAEDLEAAQVAAGKRVNLINNYFISHLAAIEEETLTIIDAISDLSGYNEIIARMRSQIKGKFRTMLGRVPDQFIKFDFNITDDGINEKEIVEKINAAREEARKLVQRIVEKFVDAITTRIAQRGGNIDSSLVLRVNEIISNLTLKPSYTNLLDAKAKVNAENERIKKKNLINLGNLQELNDE
jgi:hypothetical protein